MLEKNLLNPDTFMRAFSENLESDGQLKAEGVPKLISIMRSCKSKLVPKCMTVNIIAISSVHVQKRLLRQGLWSIIFDWLQDSMSDPSMNSFTVELLKLYSILPVSILLLQKNDSPKIIKQLTRSNNKDISSLATDIVVQWKNFVQNRKIEEPNPDQTSTQKLEITNPSGQEIKQANKKIESPTNFPVHQPEKKAVMNLKKIPKIDRQISKNSSSSIEDNLTKINLNNNNHDSSKRKSSLTEMQEDCSFINAISGNKASQIAVPKKKKKIVSPIQQIAPVKQAAKLQDSSSSPTGVTSKYNDFEKSIGQEEHHINALQTANIFIDDETKNEFCNEPIKSSITDVSTLFNMNKKKKSVSWAAGDNLTQIHFFAMDENERINVNTISLEELKRREHELEKQNICQFKSFTDDPTKYEVSNLKWYTPLAVLDTPNFECGTRSEEKVIQAERECYTLQRLYFLKDDIPDSATEPDDFGDRSAEFDTPPIEIPLEDTTQIHSDEAENLLMETNNDGLALQPKFAELVKSIAQQISPLSSSIQSTAGGPVTNNQSQTNQTNRIGPENSEQKAVAYKPDSDQNGKSETLASESHESQDCELAFQSFSELINQEMIDPEKRKKLFFIIRNNYSDLTPEQMHFNEICRVLNSLKPQLIEHGFLSANNHNSLNHNMAGSAFSSASYISSSGAAPNQQSTSTYISSHTHNNNAEDFNNHNINQSSVNINNANNSRKRPSRWGPPQPSQYPQQPVIDMSRCPPMPSSTSMPPPPPHQLPPHPPSYQFNHPPPFSPMPYSNFYPQHPPHPPHPPHQGRHRINGHVDHTKGNHRYPVCKFYQSEGGCKRPHCEFRHVPPHYS